MRRHEAANAAELAELYHAPQSPSAQEINVSVDTAFEIPERFSELYEINPDIIGWLRAGELADEPVVFRDNEFYLDHDFRGEYSGIGTVFADEKNTDWVDAQDQILVLVTCSRAGLDGRLLIFARGLREGETAEGIHAVIEQSRSR